MNVRLSNPYIAGKSITKDEDFFGRKSILSDVVSILEQPSKNAVVLYGQRRTGKTSILLKLERTLPESSFVPIYFNLLDKSRFPIHQVLFELAHTVANKVGIRTPSKNIFETNPEAFEKIFLPNLYDAVGERRPIFLLDEMDVLEKSTEVNFPETAAAITFQPFLRKLMIEEESLGFVFVVGRRMQELSYEFLSTFKIATSIPVSVFEENEARTLIISAEKFDIKFDDASIDYIMYLTKGHPYFTQLICHEVFNQITKLSIDESSPLVSVNTIEEVLPMALEKHNVAFQWIWNGLPTIEKVIFSAVATHSNAGQVLTLDDIGNILIVAGIPITGGELNIVPASLVEWQMFEKVNGGFRFFIEIMRRWVEKYHTVEQVKDELDSNIPVANELYHSAHDYYVKKNNDLSLFLLQRALELNPYHSRAHLLLGTIYRDEGNLREAISAFRQANRINEREGIYELVRALIAYGIELEKEGEESKALSVFEEVIEIQPSHETALSQRADILIKRGKEFLANRNFNEAIRLFEEAKAEDMILLANQAKLKFQIELLTEQAITNEKRQNWNEALENYQKLIELDPDNEKWREHSRRVQEELTLAEHYSKSIDFRKKGNIAAAQQHLAAIINVRPNYKDAIGLLAQTIPNPQQKRPIRAATITLPLVSALVLFVGVIFITVVIILGANNIFGFLGNVNSPTPESTISFTETPENTPSLITETPVPQVTQDISATPQDPINIDPNELANRFVVFDLKSVQTLDGSNTPLVNPEENLQLQPGLQYLAGVPFDFQYSFATQGEGLVNNPESVALPINLGEIQTVFFLIQTDWGLKQYEGFEIGEITLTFSDGSHYNYPLILGDNIRDWSRDGSGNAVSTIASEDVVEGWSGTSPDGRPGGMDILTIELPIEDQSKTLDSIGITDLTQANTNSFSPGIRILGITARIKEKSPNPWNYQIEQVPAVENRITWDMHQGETFILTGGSISYGDFSCGGKSDQICILAINATEDRTINIESLVPRNNWMAISDNISPEDAVFEVQSEFWESPNCGNGCSIATVGIFEDGNLIDTKTITASTSQSTCSPAGILGPWAPVNGQGQDITLDASDGWIHADFWSPTTTLKEGYDEVSVLIEPGTIVTVLGVAGQGWKYSLGCSREEIEQQISLHQDRRRAEGKTITTVSLDELPVQE